MAGLEFLESDDSLPVAIPITRAMRETADALAVGAPNGAIAERVRENALATLVGAAYFQLLHYTVELDRAAVRSPLRFLEDVADVPLVGIGAVECRAIARDLTAQDSVPVPLEALANRAGCLAIAWESGLASAVNSAQVLGFWPGFVLAQWGADPTFEGGPVSSLVSLDAMVDYLFKLETLERLLAAEDVPEVDRPVMAQTFAQADWELDNKRRRSFQVARILGQEGRSLEMVTKEAGDGGSVVSRQFAQRIFEAFDREIAAL